MLDRACPPTLANAPPTYVPPEESGVIAFTGPSGLEEKVPSTVLSALRRTMLGAATPPTWAKDPPRRSAEPVCTSVKFPPTNSDPSDNIVIALAVEFSSGSNFPSIVPSELSRAMKLRVVTIVEPLGSKAVKFPPTKIWPFDASVIDVTDESGVGLNVVSGMPLELRRAR